MNNQMDRATTYYMCRPLVEENKELKKRIAELEQELNNMNHLLDNYDFVNALNGKELEILKLEQQAKGVEDYAEQENKLKELYHFKDGEDIQHLNLITGLNSRAKHLRKQAAKLKEQNND